jgi:hypothetical protein
MPHTHWQAPSPSHTGRSQVVNFKLFMCFKFRVTGNLKFKFKIMMDLDSESGSLERAKQAILLSRLVRLAAAMAG